MVGRAGSGGRWLVLASLLMAARPAGADDETLHEYVPDVQPHEAALAISSSRGHAAAFEYDGELLTSPDPAAPDSAPPMVAGAASAAGKTPPGHRSPAFRPDRATELESRLSYYASFTPTVAPFKRVSSLDTVALGEDGRTPVLGVGDPELRRVAIQGRGAPSPDPRPRDRFWGEAMLDFSTGETLPLPSVAPEARILSLSSEPSVPLRIDRDGADNFYVTAMSEPPKPRVKVVFLTDAPRTYFAAEVPDVSADALAEEAPAMPRSVRKRALRFARSLGLEPGDSLRLILAELTRHFRSFRESASPPEDTGDVYLDLARSRKGVCRHRAYAFVITAQALGVPARFVQNEAHSWVETRLPGLGWMRIDLGGAAEGLEANGASGRPVYRPAHPDTLPRPDAYRESYSRLASSQVSGFRDEELAALRGRWITERPARTSTSAGDAPAGGPRASHVDRRDAVQVQLEDVGRSVRRGGSLAVSGRVRDEDGRPVADMRIEVFLKRGARHRLLLGVTSTDTAGRFRGSFGVPPDIGTGDYPLVVRAAGNARYAPAVAR